jgi:RND family efflux transporter MFP subunit
MSMIVEETSKASETPANVPSAPEAPSHQTSLRGLAIVVVLAAVALVYFLVTGLHARAAADSALVKETITASVPSVSVVTPKTTNGSEEVVLPGNVQAFTDTPLWARASGYLKEWYVDIGAHVKQGQLLAVIEAPEVDQQLQQAREQLNTDQANLKLAEITAERYKGLLQQDSIARQDVDTAIQNAAARAATVKSSQANVSRLLETVGYERVYAPFDGIITARNIDVGGLVTAGANTPGKELFHVAANKTLRVYVSVPEAYSREARPGVKTYLTLNEFPGRQFDGTLVRDTRSIDQSSRTLLVEVDVKNPTGELLPGSYVSVHFKFPSASQALTVPANTLLFRAEGLQVAAVRDGKTALLPVKLGRDFGDSVEIVHGLSPNEQVIVNPSDSIISGQAVQIEKETN